MDIVYDGIYFAAPSAVTLYKRRWMQKRSLRLMWGLASRLPGKRWRNWRLRYMAGNIGCCPAMRLKTGIRIR